MAPTKPRLMTLEFVSVTLEIFFWGGGLTQAGQCSPTESRPQSLECLSCNQGQVKPEGNNSTMESCKLLLLFKD